MWIWKLFSSIFEVWWFQIWMYDILLRIILLFFDVEWSHTSSWGTISDWKTNYGALEDQLWCTLTKIRTESHDRHIPNKPSRAVLDISSVLSTFTHLQYTLLQRRHAFCIVAALGTQWGESVQSQVSYFKTRQIYYRYGENHKLHVRSPIVCVRIRRHISATHTP